MYSLQFASFILQNNLKLNLILILLLNTSAEKEWVNHIEKINFFKILGGFKLFYFNKENHYFLKL